MRQINAADLKQKLAQTINQSMTIRNNAKHLEVHVSGPFRNHKSGKSYWIVVLGDNGQTWLIKPEFVTGYLQCLLSEIKMTTIDIGHYETYCEINIRQKEFGTESIWKRVQKNNGKPPQTIKRLSFVYSCDTNKETIGKQGLNEALTFFCLSFKKRESNPVGPLILDHIKNHADYLYKVIVPDARNHDDYANKITENMHKAFGGGDVMWNDCLNHWMVDYDIIRVLKFCGFSSWAELTTQQRELCFKDYNAKVNLPHCYIGQERYSG
jgi:hypothetical protein